jgi:integrase
LPVLGQRLLSDIDAADINRYQQARLKDGAAPKTINLEVGTMRAILRRHRLWRNIQPDVRMLKTTDDIGTALEAKEDKALLDSCADSRSRSLLPAVLVALNTGMRYGELRVLRWEQVDLRQRTVRVGRSKTDAGAGRTILLNGRATKTVQFWADQFPDPKPRHSYFRPSATGLRVTSSSRAYSTAIRSRDQLRKEAWESAKERAKVTIRFHDLRHTCVTRMLERGVPLPVVASILEWSAATTARMAKRYGHIGQVAQRQAVSVLDTDSSASEVVRKGNPRRSSHARHRGRPAADIAAIN